MAGENVWHFKLDNGQEYNLARSEITVSALRQFKQKFGPQYGKFLTFVQLLMEGDADAWCCAIWLAQKNAGEKPKPPEFMDFAVGDVMLSGADTDEDEAGEPEGEQGADPTTPSTIEPESQTHA